MLNIMGKTSLYLKQIDLDTQYFCTASVGAVWQLHCHDKRNYYINLLFSKKGLIHL